MGYANKDAEALVCPQQSIRTECNNKNIGSWRGYIFNKLYIIVLCILILNQICIEIRNFHLQSEFNKLTEQVKDVQIKLLAIDTDDDHSVSYVNDEEPPLMSTYEQHNVIDIDSNGDTSVNQRFKRSINDTRPTRKPRRSRGGNDRQPRKSRQPSIGAIHFEVDSAVYSLEIDQPGAVLNVWTQRDNHGNSFGEYKHNGTFIISEKGLYLLYSQLTYYDNSGRWCHAIKRNHNIIAKCLASEWGMTVEEGSNRYVRTVHNCYTSLVIFLRPGDRLSISSLYGSRTIHSGKDMSFWGVVRLT